MSKENCTERIGWHFKIVCNDKKSLNQNIESMLEAHLSSYEAAEEGWFLAMITTKPKSVLKLTSRGEYIWRLLNASCNEKITYFVRLFNIVDETLSSSKILVMSWFVSSNSEKHNF